MGIIFILHASVRIYNNTLPGFGTLLSAKGFPYGYYIAWGVTVFELAGGIMMFMRFLVKVFCIGQALILLVGIITVHWENELSLVGMALGSAEYSVVLITILIAIFIAERKAGRNISHLL